MDWQNDEFETLLRKFRLREARALTLVQPVSIRRYRVKIAAVAALVLAIGASAAIVRQRSMRNDVPARVETTMEAIQAAPQPPASETSAGVAAATASTIPPAPQPKASSIKPDPKVPEPLKQLAVVVPAAPQDAGPLSKQDSPQQAEAGVEETQGHKIFTAACGSCHAPEIIGNSHFDTPEEYAAIVNRMVGMGAPVSPQEAAAVVHYLFQTYGKTQGSGTEQGGKTVFNAACGLCHATDLVEARKDADKDTYRAIVISMISYGAPVAADQMDPLVEYLFKTYGRRLK